MTKKIKYWKKSPLVRMNKVREAEVNSIKIPGENRRRAYLIIDGAPPEEFRTETRIHKILTGKKKRVSVAVVEKGEDKYYFIDSAAVSAGIIPARPVAPYKKRLRAKRAARKKKPIRPQDVRKRISFTLKTSHIANLQRRADKAGKELGEYLEFILPRR